MYQTEIFYWVQISSVYFTPTVISEWTSKLMNCWNIEALYGHTIIMMIPLSIWILTKFGQTARIVAVSKNIDTKKVFK